MSSIESRGSTQVTSLHVNSAKRREQLMLKLQDSELVKKLVRVQKPPIYEEMLSNGQF